MIYRSAAVQVRPDIEESHERHVASLRRHGTWLTGEERLAIAAEVRAARECVFCADRRQAVSPYAVSGAHDSASHLPVGVVDAVHRIVTDPGRLTHQWYRELLAQGFEEGPFVELVGVVSSLVGIDCFADAVGAPYAPLGSAESGEPTRQAPNGLEVKGSWVPTVDPAKADGLVAEYYGSNPVDNLLRALTMSPTEAVAFLDLAEYMYVPADQFVDFAYERAIDRVQMEAIAVRISALNDCFY